MRIREKFAHQISYISDEKVLAFFDKIEVIDFPINVHKRFEPKTTIFVGSQTPVEHAIQGLYHHEVNHFVQLESGEFFYDLFAACVLLKRPEVFIDAPIPFLLNRYSPDSKQIVNLRSLNLTMNSTVQKPETLRSLQSYFDDEVITRPLTETGLMLADEMISNAFFHAPVDRTGKHLYNHLDRAETIDLGAETIKLMVAHDDKRLVLVCEDPFGSLLASALVKHLVGLYADGGKARPHTEGGGAGLGCKMLIDNSVSFYLVVNAGVKSLFAVGLPVGVGYREQVLTSKNLHFSAFKAKEDVHE